MCVEFRFVCDQCSSCDQAAGAYGRCSAGPAFVSNELRALPWRRCAWDEGPDLYNLHKRDARIHEVIIAGIKGEMPSFGKKLGDPDVRQLIAYLRTLRG